MRRVLLILGFLLVVCAAAAAWHNVAAGRGAMSPPESGALLVLRPLQKGLLGVGGWAADVGRAVFLRGGLVRENREMRSRLSDVEGQNLRLQKYKRENDELRALLKMPRPSSGKAVPGEVVSLDASEFTRRVVLNVGSRRGVAPKDVVFTGDGVAGQVERVSAWSSTVLLLTDRQSGVGAMTSRTKARGVVQGTGGRVCKMSYLDFGADVREGDLVLTSGLAHERGAIFPEGMVVGRVLKVEKNKTYSQTVAYIDPAVPFDRLSAVYVRTK